MEEKRLILLFSLGKESLEEISKLTAPYGVEVRPVAKDQYGLPLMNIISGKKLLGVMPYIGPDFAESLMVLHGLQGSQVDNVLSAVAEARHRPDLVALTTETNLRWSPLNLYANLTEERDAIRRAQKRNGAD